MNALIAKLQNQFLYFKQLKAFANLSKEIKQRFSTPAFFFDEVIEQRDAILDPVAVTELNLPFDTMWLVYETRNGERGVITNLLLLQKRDLTLAIAAHFRRSDLNAFNASFYFEEAIIGSSKPSPDASQLSVGYEHQRVATWSEVAPEILYCLTVLSAETTDQQEGVANGVGGNPFSRRGRDAKRSRFITVRPNAIAARSEHQGGTHASPVGHERRGHWRTSKSGKRTWVNAMSINGGATEGEVRNYRVQSPEPVADDSFVRLAEDRL